MAHLADHSNRLNDRHRLAYGEPIRQRVKRPGAGGAGANANHIADLCGLTDSAQGDGDWNAA